MRSTLIVIPMIVSAIFFYGADRAAARGARDAGVPIVSKFVCSDLCRGNETIYLYKGVTDAGECERIGGQMYSDQGWSSMIVCKVMSKRRCKEYDGRMGEFHFPFKPKNYTHLGCTADMKPEKCRSILRRAYADKPTANKYFMNNIGCMAH